MSNEAYYARHIRRSTAAGALVGGVSGGALNAARTALNNVGRKEKDKKSVLKGTALGALGGAAIGGGLGYGAGRAAVSQHKFYENLRERAQRAHYERAYKASGGKGDWNYHTYSKTTSHMPSQNHLNSLGLTGKEKTKQDVLDQYRRMARKHHPDKGGSHTKMQEINDAHHEVKKSSWFQKLGFARGFSSVGE